MGKGLSLDQPFAVCLVKEFCIIFPLNENGANDLIVSDTPSADSRTLRDPFRIPHPFERESQPVTSAVRLSVGFHAKAVTVDSDTLVQVQEFSHCSR